MRLLIFLSTVTLLAFLTPSSNAQDVSACYQSSNCDEFRACCDKTCPAGGGTAVCHSAELDGAAAPPAGASAPAKPTKAAPKGEMGFMAGAAPEEADAPAPASGAASATLNGNGKIVGAQCICNDQKSFVMSMTMPCLSSLDAPDRCGEFEKCCKDSCSKHAAFAYLCGQESDGRATSETECTCFNSLADLPGWAELEKSKDGGEAAPGDKSQYEDHHVECFNSTTSCEEYSECCVEACKRLEYTGQLEPIKMCVGNKYGKPMVSTHTFCKCPKTVAVFGISLWSDDSKGEDVASVFKGGDAMDDDGTASMPFPMMVYALLIGLIFAAVRI